MAASMSKSRLRKAFNEGRRSANVEAAQNPYDNPKLQRLWEQGRSQQRAGQIKAAIPPLEHGETRAQRATHNPPRSKRASGPAYPRRNGPSPDAPRRPGGR